MLRIVHERHDGAAGETPELAELAAGNDAAGGILRDRALVHAEMHGDLLRGHDLVVVQHR
jgi:hypothetical protein